MSEPSAAGNDFCAQLQGALLTEALWLLAYPLTLWTLGDVPDPQCPPPSWP